MLPALSWHTGRAEGEEPHCAGNGETGECSCQSRAWRNSDSELRVTRPSGQLITGFLRLQCPDWVLQLLFPDLPALLPRANLWPVLSAEDTGSWHTTALLRNPNLFGGMGSMESGPGRSPSQGSGLTGNQVGSYDCYPDKGQVMMMRGGTCW